MEQASTGMLSQRKSSGDIDLLYSVVQAEAGNQDIQGQQLVTDVILNRLDDPRFPNTIEDVVYAPGQFSVVRNGKLAYAVATDQVKAAVNAELDGEQVNDDILYFNNSDNGGWKYGDHWFK